MIAPPHRTSWFSLTALTLIPFVLLCALALYFTALKAPERFPNNVVVTVESQESLRLFAADLRSAGVVRSSGVFFSLARLFGAKAVPAPGSYRMKNRENALSLAWRVAHHDFLMPQTPLLAAAVRPPASGQHRVHDFTPTEFHRAFSDSARPSLHIYPGDTVKTWTLDSGGRDAQGVRRSLRGNPQTGPFYVEGAAPGDTLIVRLTKLTLNRDSAHSGSWISPSAVGKEYSPDTPNNNAFDSDWTLDRKMGIARLKNPTTGLKNYSIKLHPMLGCIAVAPPSHQVVSTSSLGAFGGNLDYNQIREGATVYLPVFAPGALLFLGDAHAAQGDGELTGDALETSMQVEFTVDLEKGVSTAFPRVENSEYLMASGIAQSLPEALQIATAQLAKWMQKRNRLQSNEVAVLFGGSLQYDIAEVVDPQVHVVAKLAKDLLP